jgi:hypothetical protein
MWTGKLRAVGVAIALALVALVLVSCGSDGDGNPAVAKAPAIHADTAAHLAKLSDRVASELDAGNTCDAAYAADQLQSAVDEANLPATMRPGVDEVASRLVDDVNCPPPPPAPEPEKDKPKKDEEHGNDQGDEHGNGHGDEGKAIPPGHMKQGGIGPAGKEKLKGEAG